MGIDITKMRERADASRKSGMFFKFPEGDTLAYLCPPTADMDGLPYVEVLMHYGVGGKGKSVVCLDHGANEVLSNPAYLASLKNRKITLNPEDPCPACARVSGEVACDLPEEELDGMQAKAQKLFLIIPWGKVSKGERIDLPERDREPRPIMVGKMVGDGIIDVVVAEGDITNSAEATLLRVGRVGTTKDGTKYTVNVDGATLRHPIQLPKPQRALLRKSQEPGGEGDLYRLIANLTKSTATMEELLSGGDTIRRTPPIEDDGKPRCFALDCDPGDEECRACPWKEPCAEKCGVSVPPEPTAKAGARPAPKPEPTKPTVPVPLAAERARRAVSPPVARPAAPSIPVRRAVRPPEPEPEEEPEADDTELEAPTAEAPSEDGNGEDEADEFERELRARRARRVSRA